MNVNLFHSERDDMITEITKKMSTPIYKLKEALKGVTRCNNVIITVEGRPSCAHLGHSSSPFCAHPEIESSDSYN
jgi:hypothetical protein